MYKRYLGLFIIPLLFIILLPSSCESHPVIPESFTAETESLTEWQSFFDDMFVGRFLRSEYDSPEKIDLKELISAGKEGKGWSYSYTKEEEEFITQHPECRDLEIDPVRWTTAELDEVLEKYLNYPFDEVMKDQLSSVLYWDKTDAYYMGCGGISFKYMITGYEYIKEDLVQINWTCNTAPGTQSGTVQLRRVDGRWVFVSNIIKQKSLS